MRVIIEVDNEQELERALTALKADVIKDQPIQVVAGTRAPSRRERQVILQRVYDRYQIKLPEGWKFNRDEANER